MHKQLSLPKAAPGPSFSDRVLVTSRPFGDLVKMFGELPLPGSHILVVPGGACDWRPALAERGIACTMVDPQYGRGQDALCVELAHWHAVIGTIAQSSGFYTPAFLQNLPQIKSQRSEAQARFFADFRSNASGYVNDVLPALSGFPTSGDYTLALMSFFLPFYELPGVDFVQSVNRLWAS